MGMDGLLPLRPAGDVRCLLKGCLLKERQVAQPADGATRLPFWRNS
jgi:hypothetical protein